MYPINSIQRKMPPYAYADGQFTEEELAILKEIAITSENDATVGSSGRSEVNKNIRKTKVKFLDYSKEYDWLFSKVSFLAEDLNQQFYGFDLSWLGEPLQFTNYLSSEKGCYKWHQDMGAIISRKLSFVLQLSNPEEYEGGELQLMVGSDEPVQVEKKKGKVVVFPSWTVHRVTEVTKGSRQSMVCWVTGKCFK